MQTDSIAIDVLGIVVVLAAAAFVLSVVIDRRFGEELRRGHPETWERLGAPAFWSRTLRTTITMTRFVLGGEYARLGNRRLTRLGGLLRAASTAFLFLFALIVVIMSVRSFWR
jgi:hypothetical protein